MNHLDELIEVDDENISSWRERLAELDPELPAALGTAAEMFRTFSRCISGGGDRIQEEELREIIDSAVWNHVRPLVARLLVFLLLERQYMWAATDLLRGRLTPALGYKRLQAESLALLLLMRDDPEIAGRWLEIRTDDEGRAFYQTFRGRIRNVIDSLGLSMAYEMGSGVALHVRPSSAAHSLSFSPGPPLDIQLSYQEIRENDPFSYLLEVLHFLTTQRLVFEALATAFPEATDPIWPQRVRIFGHTVDGLWEKLEQKYPEPCQRFLRMLKRT